MRYIPTEMSHKECQLRAREYNSISPFMDFPFCCKPSKQAACHIAHSPILSIDSLSRFQSPCFAAFRYEHPLGYLHSALISRPGGNYQPHDTKHTS